MKKRIISVFLRELFVLLISIIYLIPIYYFLLNAFKSQLDMQKTPFLITPSMFTLDNVIKSFERLNYFRSLLTNLIIAGLSLFILILLCSAGSFALGRIKSKIFDYYYVLIVTSMALPFTVALVPLVLTLKDYNILSTIWSPIVIQTAWNAPFTLFLFTGFMRSLPKELEDSSYLDGCSMIGTYFRIFLPLLKPITATSIIVVGLGIWNDFLVCYLTVSTKTWPSLQVGLYSFFGKYVQEYNLAFAGILMTSLPIILTFIFLQKYFVKGIAAGAIKG